MTYKLVSATPSPFARKVRIALAEKNLPFELLTDVPWDRTTLTPSYNPLEKLPVLILENGSSIYDSSFILQFLEWTHPEPPLLPDGIEGRVAARKLEVLCDGICDAVVLTFFERMRAEQARSAEWLARQQRKIDGGLREMARLVGDREWAVGERFSLGDIAVGTAVGYLSLRLAELPWRSLYPNLVALSARLEARPSFMNSVPTAQTISDKVM